MPVEVAGDGSPPAAVKLPQTGFYVGPRKFPTPAVEHVYVRADRFDDVEVYQYLQVASAATD